MKALLFLVVAQVVSTTGGAPPSSDGVTSVSAMAARNLAAEHAAVARALVQVKADRSVSDAELIMKEDAIFARQGLSPEAQKAMHDVTVKGLARDAETEAESRVSQAKFLANHPELKPKKGLAGWRQRREQAAYEADPTGINQSLQGIQSAINAQTLSNSINHINAINAQPLYYPVRPQY